MTEQDKLIQELRDSNDFLLKELIDARTRLAEVENELSITKDYMDILTEQSDGECKDGVCGINWGPDE